MKISKLFTPDGPSDFSKRDRIIVISIYLVPASLLFGIAYSLSHDIMLLEFLFAYYILSIPTLVSIYYNEKYVEIFGGYSSLHPPFFTYQYYLGMYLAFIPGLIAFILPVGDFFNRLNLAILICLGFIIPLISSVGVGIFNDSSCYIEDEIVLGYPPFYQLFSLIVGLFGFYNVYNLLDVNFNSAICLFIITVIFQIIFVIPNWINKIAPFEVRKTEGFIVYNALTGAVYRLISFLFMGSAMFPPIHLNLTPEGIIRKTIVWGIGIIFAILIIRQAMNMGKRKNK